MIEALIDGECVGSGTGKSKKSAEQQAAYGVEEIPIRKFTE